jgi:methionyl-tRNA formyltransferase
VTERLRIAFAGTPEFARVALERLHAAGFEIALVLTQPDRPAGRGMKLQPSAVKAFALERGLTLAQPRSLRLDGKTPEDAAAARAALEVAAPDVIVVAAYGLMLPTWVLALPRLGCLNIHASLLPRWRGAAPIHRAIEAGDTQTGITIMQMDAGLDTGPMLATRRTPILPTDDSQVLHDRLAQLGAELLAETIPSYVAGTLRPQPQPATGSTYAAKIKKEDGQLNWHQPATQLCHRLRAFTPWPGAFTFLQTATKPQLLKIWQVEVVATSGAPGTILSADKTGIIVGCGQGALRILELQREGGKRLPAAAFLAGFPLQAGQQLA